jgi:hypothetical protein
VQRGQVISGRLFVSRSDAPELFEFGNAAFDEVTIRIGVFVERIFYRARGIVGNDGDGLLGHSLAKRLRVVRGGDDEIGLESLDERQGLRRIAGLTGGPD